jgi:hypothetical protein
MGLVGEPNLDRGLVACRLCTTPHVVSRCGMEIDAMCQHACSLFPSLPSFILLHFNAPLLRAPRSTSILSSPLFFPPNHLGPCLLSVSRPLPM